MSGEKGEAEKWFSEFEEVNRLRKKDNDTSVKILAYYLSGVYSIFRGKLAEGRQELQVAVQTDESDLLARHALLWIDGGLFRGLNQRSE
jgi:hypothetical protein